MNPRFFYSSKKDASDDESEHRWKGGHQKLVSNSVVPESNPPDESDRASSSALSAPTSGFSSVKGSVNTSPPHSRTGDPSKKMFSFPNMLKSRFTKALQKGQTSIVAKADTSKLAVDVLTHLQRKNGLPLPTTSTHDLCSVWMSGANGE